ncbi:MAG: 1,4-butanediol diacrylate esterase [Comamonas sp. SCN 65-56]|uniref:serine hydrolase domain-containing protein n=1 Tax=Comamonas sp. SCN 65-56 TaxID=1660095 RepID=UPI000868B74F|nr:serine hydrolase domain-containing protein [Comamonas sp. SCN 65-56]ODS91428.1 MAG: 1,4-butanediol diacrylate esterase [Comamonas sp. SCN 65-56]
MTDFTKAIDAVLDGVTTGTTRVPGVSAAVTDRLGTIYQGSRGVRNTGTGEPFEPDTVCAIFSTTKAIAGTACLQLVEDGLLDLDAPAKEYVSQLGDIQVIEGFDSEGKPKLRAPRRDVTTRHLLTHTAGFAYDFFNETYTRLANGQGQPWVVDASWKSIKTPLLFDPGEQWEYGTSIDWAGMVVEAITGRRLGEVMQTRILGPLGMNDTAFTMTPSMKARQATIHAREDGDGSLIPLDGVTLPQEPELHMGGHGLYGTATDYVKFIRMWLNDGRSDSGEQILRPETVEMASRNHLPKGMHIKMLPGVGATNTAKSILPVSKPRLSNDAEFFPGMPKTWALTFMINEEPAPTGRPAGSLAWAGLANLYYWIDRKNGVGGYWATQIFPFADPTSVAGFLEMERATYQYAKLRG